MLARIEFPKKFKKLKKLQPTTGPVSRGTCFIVYTTYFSLFHVSLGYQTVKHPSIPTILGDMVHHFVLTRSIGPLLDQSVLAEKSAEIKNPISGLFYPNLLI